MGAAVAEWLSSWHAEQEDRGSIPGLATWIFRDWLSPASKSRYGWKIAKSTLILKTTNVRCVDFSIPWKFGITRAWNFVRKDQGREEPMPITPLMRFWLQKLVTIPKRKGPSGLEMSQILLFPLFTLFFWFFIYLYKGNWAVRLNTVTGTKRNDWETEKNRGCKYIIRLSDTNFHSKRYKHYAIFS